MYHKTAYRPTLYAVLQSVFRITKTVCQILNKSFKAARKLRIINYRINANILIHVYLSSVLILRKKQRETVSFSFRNNYRLHIRLVVNFCSRELQFTISTFLLAFLNVFHIFDDAPKMGVELPVEVMHTSEYLLTLNLSAVKAAGRLYYLESDYLRNYNDLPFPHELLKNLGAEEQHFGADRDWLGVPDQQESFTCGEGAVVLPKLYPELVKKLAAYIEKQADDPAADRIVTASPYTKLCLTKYTSLKVETLEEAVLKAL